MCGYYSESIFYFYDCILYACLFFIETNRKKLLNKKIRVLLKQIIIKISFGKELLYRICSQCKSSCMICILGAQYCGNSARQYKIRTVGK